jgi:hypothetical protein
VKPLAPYIGIGPAIRLIVEEKLLGGPEHAAQMTDSWIIHLLRGGAWETDPKVLESFRAAARALEDAALDATVHVVGVDMTSRSAAPRQIEAHERGNHSLYMRENVFAGQPPFDAPQFCIEDLRRVIPKVEGEVEGPERIISKIFHSQSPPLAFKTAFKMARAAGVKEPRNKIEVLWKSLGGPTRPGPKGPRNNRPAPTG